MPPRAARGFTLLEALVVLAIVGIVGAVGVPQLQNFSHKRQVDSQVASLASSFRLARAEAIRRGRLVTVCPSENPDAVAPTCSAGGGVQGWSTGWIVFEDDIAAGGRGAIDAGDTILSVQSPFRGSGGIVVNTAGYFITFQGNGLPVRGNPFPNTTFTVYPNSSDKLSSRLSKQIVIDVVGRARVTPLINP